VLTVTGLNAHSARILLLVALVFGALGLDAASSAAPARAAEPAITSVYAVPHPRGLMVTSGGWPYCLQVQALARNTGYTLLCARYYKDGYVGYGLRAQRHLDWGDPGYLASLAQKVEALHKSVGGKLVLIGVSYSGFGVATFASHHPEVHPTRLIVIDSYLDLVARRHALPAAHETAKEIDAETGGSDAALQQRTVSVAGLAQLVRSGTQLTVIWSISADEQKEFAGATCNRTANAGVLEQLASTLGKPVSGWVTQSRHGHDLWDRGRAIIAGKIPGREVAFRPNAPIPADAICGS
jgi:pimeloyl-ACP methyl ester carboxylesterase